MSWRICAEPGCPEFTQTTRCESHTRIRDKARGTRQQRGYDTKHDRLRSAYQRHMNHGETFNCWRCGEPIDPQSWTLGHCDDDRTIYHGPECPPCDYATAGRTAQRCPHPSHA